MTSPSTTPTPHQHDNCAACREEHYAQAKDDPVASVVLDAMHKQDAATYHGVSDDMGQLALDAAAKIREAIANG